MNLIYKIIHDHSNYERHQWTIFGFDKDIVEKELKYLLLEISKLDKKLTWDCLSIFHIYRSLLDDRQKITKKYVFISCSSENMCSKCFPMNINGFKLFVNEQ